MQMQVSHSGVSRVLSTCTCSNYVPRRPLGVDLVEALLYVSAYFIRNITRKGMAILLRLDMRTAIWDCDS